MKVVIVVASATGHTRQMAEAFAKGTRDAGAEDVVLRDAADATEGGPGPAGARGGAGVAFAQQDDRAAGGLVALGAMLGLDVARNR